MKKINFSKLFSLIIVCLTLFTLCFALTANVRAEEVQYETPDYISISDLSQNGKLVGSKIVLSSHQKYNYTNTATNYSAIFSFKYKCLDPSTVDCQIHFKTTWLGDDHGGLFWLRDDKNRISKMGKGYLEADPFPAVGTYNVELGKLYIESGANQGKYYMYLSVDGTKVLEYIIDEMPKDAGFFMTGKNGDILMDSDWVGSKVTYTVNGEQYQQFNTLDDYLTKPADPEVPGETFVGWYTELGTEWDFENDPVTDNLVLKAGFARKPDTVSDEVYFADSTYTPVLRFSVASDVHIGTNASVRNDNLAEALDVAYSYANNSSTYKKLDAALFAGDISDSGDLAGLTSFNTTAQAHIKSGTQLVVSMGNHDFRGGTVDDSISNFEGLFGSADKHLIINGYHFIALSPDTDEGEHFSASKVQWLEQELAAAQEADPTKPIFVMQHEGIKGTVYGSEGWGVSELTDVLSKYPQVVDFSGHSHFPLADPRSIWQGTFTALGTGTLHFYEMGINGYKYTGVFPTTKDGKWGTGANSASSCAEYLIVEIDANNAIRIIAYDLISNAEITRYYIRNVMDDVKFTYSIDERAKSSVKPVFAETAAIDFIVRQNSFELEFNQATCEDIIESYRIEVYEGTELVKTEYALSDYFFFPNPTKIRSEVTKLKSTTDYTVKIYAVNVWGDSSLVPLTGTVTTGQAEEEKLADYDDINILDIDYPENTGILENIPSESKQYHFNGSSETYSSVITYYLITGNLTASDEYRHQVGTVWNYRNTFWIQTGKYDCVFYSWIYSARTSDRSTYAIESNKIYKIESGTIYVEAGENEGKVYTYLKINDELLKSFYGDPNEAPSADYDVSFHISSNYKVADVSLARTIEYYVDDNKTTEVFAINGLTTTAPASPKKDGWYFVGWYTDPVAGERVDFRNPVNSSDSTIKYYARFTDETFNLKLYSEGKLIDTQVVGKDCEALVPETPTKTGAYKYSFVKWVIKGTDTEFDFSTRIEEDIELEAVFEEYKYRIKYLVDGVEYVTKYYQESNPEVIIGGEPEVPALKGATGYWVYSSERDAKDIYVTCVYNGTKTTASTEITLNKFDGAVLDIADDLTRYYLSFADTEQQAAWLQSYPVSGGHERQDITFSWNDTSRNSAYLVYFADNENFEDAFVIRTESRSVDYVGIFVPGETYYWKVLGLSNDKWSQVDTFEILDTPVRWISAGTVFNMRDIGGWTTADNKQVKYGLIYRGGQLSLDNSGEKSYMDEYSYKVFDYLGIKTEIELRGDQPHDYNQFNELANLVFVNGTGYTDFFRMGTDSKNYYKTAFAALADINNYPIYFHCSWGADRTGGLGFLINAILGVPYEQLVQDYELTSLSYSGVRTRYGYSNGAFDAMYKQFMKDYRNSESETLQDAVIRFLTNFVGVPMSQITAIQQIMLTDATSTLTTHKVTYKIDGEIYQESLVFDGGYIKDVVPFYMEKHLSHWVTPSGEVFDPSTKVTKDLVLEAVFVDTLYEDYDVVTLRDIGLGEQAIPSAGMYSIEGSTTTGSRLFVIDYKITATDSEFNDGVHISIGAELWDWKAQLWIQSTSSQHIFTGSSKPTASYTRSLDYGKTYRITVGVIMPIDGEYAGKKMFIFKLNDEVVCFLETPTDIGSNFNIGIAGTEGIMYSIDNKNTVKFIGSDGTTVIETKEVNRGEYVTEINNPKSESNRIFLGWYDALGNRWNFETNKVLRDVILFAKYGDRTISAVVIDEFDMVIQNEYKVKLGLKVSEIELPIVNDDSLVFDGWYNGETKLSADDVITENMELICKFSVVENPTPVDPVEPAEKGNFIEKILSGCNATITLAYGFTTMIALAGAIILKKKREN